MASESDTGHTAWAVRIGGGHYFRRWATDKNGKPIKRMVTSFSIAGAKLFPKFKRADAEFLVERILKNPAYKGVLVHVVTVWAEERSVIDLLHERKARR